MKATLSIKFYEDSRNRQLVEALTAALREAGIELRCIQRDVEGWGEKKFPPDELMRITFEEIDAADLHVVEFSEKGVGLGIEAGYAFARKKPVYVVAREGSEISETIRGVACAVFFYKETHELARRFKAISTQPAPPGRSAAQIFK